MTNDTLNVALVQTALAWENPKANRTHIEDKVSSITADLIVLPEMFSSGFTMNGSEVAETMDGKTITWLKSLSKTKNAAIVGSLVIAENNNFYNPRTCKY